MDWSVFFDFGIFSLSVCFFTLFFLTTVVLSKVSEKRIYFLKYHAQIKKSLSEGVHFDIFLVDEGREDPNKWAIIGPPAKRH